MSGAISHLSVGRHGKPYLRENWPDQSGPVQPDASNLQPRGVMRLRIRGQVLSVFVPEGLMIVARQFIAWNASIENPPRRVRSDPYPGLINRANGGAPIGPNHTVPYGTDPVFAPIPGNKLPGYDH